MILLVLPNQLFAEHPGLDEKPDCIILTENSLFFGDNRYPASMHQQKLWLHRATMKRYQAMLEEQGHTCCYLDYDSEQQSIRDRLSAAMADPDFKGEKSSQRFVTIDPVDFILEKRLRQAAESLGMELELLPNPGFLNRPEQNSEYRAGKKRWFMADFYKWQRTRMNLLMDGDEPLGGQWSFDEENRKKVPKKLLSEIPSNLELERDDVDQEAVRYVREHFSDRPGNLNRLYYPTSHDDAQRWLKHFLEYRFERFGDYEDAIEEGESWLWHSVLTPALNIGLLTPQQIIDETMRHLDSSEIPINSVEGFLRQVVGWREFMRATYEDLGVKMRTTNHWNHTRSLPDSLYDATTGIDPVDDTIRRLLDTGYCHHIERLMVLGGFMFLCEIDPDEIYRWFMEMFVDSYDWVMVTNAYAMSQNADGGLITTKPYFSGSSYVRKMSHYAKGPWCEIWDGLYWRWIWRHADELEKNPRWAMMCSMARKMDEKKRETHLQNAANFLRGLR